MINQGNNLISFLMGGNSEQEYLGKENNCRTNDGSSKETSLESLDPVPNQGPYNFSAGFQENFYQYPRNPISSVGRYRQGDWICNLCKNHNYSFREVCNRCKKQVKSEADLITSMEENSSFDSESQADELPQNYEFGGQPFYQYPNEFLSACGQGQQNPQNLPFYTPNPNFHMALPLNPQNQPSKDQKIPFGQLNPPRGKDGRSSRGSIFKARSRRESLEEWGRMMYYEKQILKSMYME
jgi:hypothetical protein